MRHLSGGSMIAPSSADQSSFGWGSVLPVPSDVREEPNLANVRLEMHMERTLPGQPSLLRTKFRPIVILGLIQGEQLHINQFRLLEDTCGEPVARHKDHLVHRNPPLSSILPEIRVEGFKVDGAPLILGL